MHPDVEYYTGTNIVFRRYTVDDGGMEQGRTTTHGLDGSVIGIYNFVDGKYHGLCMEWHDNGTLSWYANFVDDKVHGTTMTWWPSGVLSTLINYIDGVRDGWARTWNEDGELISEKFYVDGEKI